MKLFFLVTHRSPFGYKIEIRIELLNSVVQRVDDKNKTVGILNHRHRAVELAVAFSEFANDPDKVSFAIE